MKKLQFAMVGGGNGALIGDIHRIGAQFDDLAELKAGCFSRHWDKNLEAGEKWGVEPGRIYPDYHTMLEEEAKRTGEDRLDFVVVATPTTPTTRSSRTSLPTASTLSATNPSPSPAGSRRS